MTDTANLPEPFRYYREIFQSDHLHFGLWPNGDTALPLEEAQEVMFRHLLCFFCSATRSSSRERTRRPTV